MSYAEHRKTAEAMKADRVKRYSSGGDIASDKAMIRKAFKQHENAEHGGKHEKILKTGGAVPAARADKKARGGSAHKKGHPNVNVIVAGSPSAPPAPPQKVPVPVPVPMRPPMGAGPMGPGGPGGPPPMGPPPGAMGPGGPPPPGLRPPGMARRGGAIAKAAGGSVNKPLVPMDAGGGGGKGRLEKVRAYGAKPRKAKGGRACA